MTKTQKIEEIQKQISQLYIYVDEFSDFGDDPFNPLAIETRGEISALKEKIKRLESE